MADLGRTNDHRTKGEGSRGKSRSLLAFRRSGEGGIRTRDTTIFSRVLYQLSYLAWGAERLRWAKASGRRTALPSLLLVVALGRAVFAHLPAGTAAGPLAVA
jgi:hypothetical protein